MIGEVITRITEKGDEWINPIVIKELRQAMRSKFVIMMVMLFLLVQIVGLAIYLVSETDSNGQLGFYAGRDLFTMFLIILLVAGVICIPAYAAARLSSERTDINVDLIFITALPPRMIISGKFLATLMLAVILYSACMPFMTFTYILRGIDLPTVIACLALGMLMIVFCIQAAIFYGCMSGNKYIKSFLGLSFIGGLFMVLGITIGFCEEMIRRGIDNSGFWEVAATVTILSLLGTGCFYVLSLAVILPPSANRALPVRLFMAAAWLVSGGIALYWGLKGGDREAIYGWCVGSVITFCAGLLFSISERDSLGVRLRRQIPAFPLMRRVAFLLYSGAAGGVIFCCLIIASTLVTGALSLASLSYVGRSAEDALLGSAGMALSVFDYAMLAVLLRQLFWSKKIPHHFLWAIALVLMAAGMIGPLLISTIVTRSASGPLVWLGNPFAGFFNYNDMREVFFGWVIIWAIVLTVVNLPWFIKQISGFQPYESSAATPTVPKFTIIK